MYGRAPSTQKNETSKTKHDEQHISITYFRCWMVCRSALIVYQTAHALRSQILCFVKVLIRQGEGSTLKVLSSNHINVKLFGFVLLYIFVCIIENEKIIIISSKYTVHCFCDVLYFRSQTDLFTKMAAMRTCTIDFFPENILIEILSYLNVQELIRSAR